MDKYRTFTSFIMSLIIFMILLTNELAKFKDLGALSDNTYHL
jgi:hypothetical protein